MNKQSVGIIGFGKLGRTLAMKFMESDRLGWICSASACREAPQDIKCYASLNEIDNLADIIFITKADKYIEQTAEHLAERFGTALKGKTVIHCSGIFAKDILESCKKNGALIASAHPYQTFYGSQKNVLNNISWAVDAGNDFEMINEIIKELKGKAINTAGMNDFNHTLYHASAVMASNYMNTIIALASDTAEKAGINPADFLPEILKTTLDNNINALDKNGDFPLTGPIARGDIITVEKHIEELKPYILLCREYCRIGLSTAELAYKYNYIDKKTYKTLTGLFISNID
jgi:predicted short-subunit dehydrogenase-like oxidoreductase (DUF2520 family)